MSYSAPTRTDVRTKRLDLGLTQAQAAALIHVSTATWQQYEQDRRSMHPGFWELFTIKSAKLDT